MDSRPTRALYPILLCDFFFGIISTMSSGRLTSPNRLNVDSIMELAIADFVSSSWSFFVSFFVMAFISLILIFSLNTRICDIKSVSVFIASSWSFNLNLFFLTPNRVICFLVLKVLLGSVRGGACTRLASFGS